MQSDTEPVDAFLDDVFDRSTIVQDTLGNCWSMCLVYLSIALNRFDLLLVGIWVAAGFKVGLKP